MIPEDILRKKWKEVGLGLAEPDGRRRGHSAGAAQPLVRKYIPAAGPAVVALACLATYIAGARLIERRKPTELAANRALPEGTAGIAIGFLLFAVVMAILLVMGVYHPAGWGTTAGWPPDSSSR